MKTKAALTGVILSLAFAVSIFSCVPSGKAPELKKAAKDKDLLLSLCGTESFNSMNLQAKNNAKSEKKILVPRGAVLSSQDETFQPMLISADTEIVLAPGEEKTVSLPTYSMGYHKYLPTAEDAYQMTGYSLTKDPVLKKILAYLESESGKADYPADNPEMVNVVQQVIWLITDKVGYDENIGYIIDSMMFSTIIQSNPTVISLMLDNSESITDEASAQAAVYALAMDKERLREKLRTVFEGEYDGTVENIRANIEESAGPTFRKSVTDFISKAGLELTY